MKLCSHRFTHSIKGISWCFARYENPKPVCTLWDVVMCKVRRFRMRM